MNQFASALRAPRGGRLPALSVADLRSVKHRHSSDLCRSAPGALAPVRVVVSRSIITYSAPSAPLAGTPRLRLCGLYAVPTLCGSAPATREWFRAFACCSFLSCRPLGPRGVHGRLSSSPPAAALAFAIGGTARHSQHLHHPLQVEGGFRGFPVRFRYDLTGCSPPFGGSDQVQLQGQFMTRRSYAVSMKCLRQAPSQPAQPQEAFTPRLSAVRSPSLLLGITTAATGILCRWDFHPLEQQLASLHVG